MSGRVLTVVDCACRVGNTMGQPAFEGQQRDLIELALRRLIGSGYRILGPGELDKLTVEACAGWHDQRYRDTLRTLRADGGEQ